MTGPEHYEAAENLLADAAALYETDASKARFKQAAAHTHAILAQTMAALEAGGITEPHLAAWDLVAS